MSKSHSFLYHFSKSTEEGERHKWKFYYDGSILIVDEIIANVSTKTLIQDEAPLAVVTGEGIVNISYYKDGTYKCIRITIEKE